MPDVFAGVSGGLGLAACGGADGSPGAHGTGGGPASSSCGGAREAGRQGRGPLGGRPGPGAAAPAEARLPASSRAPGAGVSVGSRSQETPESDGHAGLAEPGAPGGAERFGAAAAASVPGATRARPHGTVQRPVDIKIKSNSEKATPRKEKNQTSSRSLQDTGPAPAGGESLQEKQSYHREVAHAPPPVLRKPRGGQWPAPASRLPPEEAVAAAVQNDTHSPISEGSEDRFLALAPVLAGEFPDSVPRDTELQTLPVSPGPSSEPVDQVTAAPEKEKTQEKQHPRGKVEQVLSDGRTIITFPNGTRKEISADKKTTLIRFFNGDVKKIKPDQRVVYYYADAQTTHTTFPNGMEIVQFPNKRTEKFHPDGSKETVYPDGTVTRLRGGCEETVFPDGTVVCVQRNGDRTITLSNGQKEIHTAHFKRREFPDGTSKTVYGSGCREIKYASGRLQVRDQTGSVILDRKAQPPADKHC
ncbi:neurofilament heavy polypeptide-like isoform X1 [Dipodomys merriami]|uniref:neurofilament heavy polypeptide-like isoform X1 n=1 Tax=Dipodomys merriami TaxID=94247 RepID=UPI0038560B44